MLHQAAICHAFFTNPGKLAKGPGSALVSGLLQEIAGNYLCILEIERPDGRFSLVLDTAWAALGLQVSALDGCDELNDSVPLPRSALRAVVAGWALDWDEQINPTLGVHLSDDDIPHVSLSEVGARRESEPTLHSGLR